MTTNFYRFLCNPINILYNSAFGVTEADGDLGAAWLSDYRHWGPEKTIPQMANWMENDGINID